MRLRAPTGACANRHVPVLFSGSLVLGATAVGLTGALGLQCSGEGVTSVTTTHVRIRPQGPSAENSLDLSDSVVAVALSFKGTCWAATPILYSGLGRGRALAVAPPPKKRTWRRRLIDARGKQKRANRARLTLGTGKPGLRVGLYLVLGATAVGLTGALGLQCSGEGVTSVTTTHVRIRPQGPSAENSSCRTGWVYQQGPRTP